MHYPGIRGQYFPVTPEQPERPDQLKLTRADRTRIANEALDKLFDFSEIASDADKFPQFEKEKRLHTMCDYLYEKTVSIIQHNGFASGGHIAQFFSELKLGLLSREEAYVLIGQIVATCGGTPEALKVANSLNPFDALIKVKFLLAYLEQCFQVRL